MFRTKYSVTALWSVWAGIVWVAVVGALTAQQAGKEDQDKIQGPWKVVSAEMQGNALPAADAVRFKFHFVRDQLLMHSGAQGMLAEVKLDPKSTPKTIDMVVTEQKKVQGIYELDGDKLKMCFGDPNREAPRPTKFVTGKDDGNLLFVMERAKPAPGDKSGEDLLKEYREAAPRRLSATNLRQLGIAMHNYHNDYLQLPSPATYSKDGKPLLSWRVAVLPYLEEDQLYKQFKLDEPWDSAGNKALLAKMPKIYAPVQGKTKEPHSTYYRVFVSSADEKLGAAFTDQAKLSLGQLTVQDGTSNTIMIVEAGEAVPWTKPDELVYDPKKPLPKLGGLFADGFHACFADCSVPFFKKDIYADEITLRGLITRNGGEAVDSERYRK